MTAPSVRALPPRVADAAALARLLAAGESVFLPGSAAEVPALIATLCDSAAPPLAITGTLVPGINACPVEHFAEGTVYSSIFAPPAPRGAHEAGRIRHLPMSYGAFARRLETMTFDTAVVQVSPPDADGLCSFGPSVEFSPIALSRARRVLAVVNPQTPRMPGADVFRLAEAAAFVEIDAPLTAYDVGEPSADASTIAALIARFVEDGATLQVGLGKAPDALMRQLADRRRLKLHSGMLSDGARLLAEADCLDPDFEHMSCVHVGSRSHYAWLRDNPLFAVRSCAVTHDPARLAALKRLVAVNSALSVDLFGQANLEMLNGRMVSGVGGAADFLRAAANAGDGLSIISLPATSGRSNISRIVPRLDGVASIPRHDVDVVITEHGVADLRTCSTIERGERLIEIAAEDHRPALRDAFADIVARL